MEEVFFIFQRLKSPFPSILYMSATNTSYSFSPNIWYFYSVELIAGGIKYQILVTFAAEACIIPPYYLSLMGYPTLRFSTLRNQGGKGRTKANHYKISRITA